LKCVSYSAKTFMRWRSLRINIRSVTSRRALPIQRSHTALDAAVDYIG
jgi:hypothetical protein